MLAQFLTSAFMMFNSQMVIVRNLQPTQSLSVYIPRWIMKDGNFYFLMRSLIGAKQRMHYLKRMYIKYHLTTISTSAVQQKAGSYVSFGKMVLPLGKN
jgi:hypothetical protein